MITDKSPRLFQILYTVGTILVGVLTLLGLLNIIDDQVAITVGGIIKLLSGAIGTAGLGTAARRVTKQIDLGWFDDKTGGTTQTPPGIPDPYGQLPPSYSYIRPGLPTLLPEGSAAANAARLAAYLDSKAAIPDRPSGPLPLLNI